MFHVPEEKRVIHGQMGSTPRDGNNGLFTVKSLRPRQNLRIIASDGEGWEHVSVSLPDRIPTWLEMCTVKDTFWDGEDVVVQFHPRRSEYVDCHPFCLHLWRPRGRQFPTPPSILVGPR